MHASEDFGIEHVGGGSMKEVEEILKPLEPVKTATKDCELYLFFQNSNIASITICKEKYLYGEIFGNKSILRALLNLGMDILWRKPNYYAFEKAYESKQDLIKDLETLVQLYKK